MQMRQEATLQERSIEGQAAVYWQAAGGCRRGGRQEHGDAPAEQRDDELVDGQGGEVVQLREEQEGELELGDELLFVCARCVGSELEGSLSQGALNEPDCRR